MPRPAHTPTDFQRGTVAGLAATGMPQETIARRLGIALGTLRKHYALELETAQANRVSEVAESLYKVAMGKKHSMPKVVAAIFLLKTQGRWRETSTLEHTGADGAPLPAKDPITIVLPWNGRDPHLVQPDMMETEDGRVVPYRKPLKLIEGNAIHRDTVVGAVSIEPVGEAASSLL